MEFKRLLLNDTVFAAGTNDLNIPADHVKYLDIGLRGENCGSTSSSVAVVGALIDEIQLTLGGENICNIHYVDLLALNHIWEDIFPHYMTSGAADNANWSMDGVRLPLHVTKCGKGLSVRLTYAANALICDMILSLAYQYRETPFASHFNYQYREALSTAAFQEINLDYAGAECIGILLFNTTIPICTIGAVVSDIDEVAIIVDDREIYRENWHTMTRLHENTDTTDDIAWGIHEDNYRWLDFQQEPLPSGKLRMLTNGTTTGHTIRIIPVYIQKNQAQ